MPEKKTGLQIIEGERISLLEYWEFTGQTLNTIPNLARTAFKGFGTHEDFSKFSADVRSQTKMFRKLHVALTKLANTREFKEAIRILNKYHQDVPRNMVLSYESKKTDKTKRGGSAQNSA